MPGPPSAEPATPEALALHLKCLLTDGVSERIEACTSAINSGLLTPKMQANTLAVRGTMYLRQRRHTDARIDFEQAKRLDPENPQIDQGLALIARSEARTTPEQLAQVQSAFDCRDLEDAVSRLAACDQFVARTAGQPAHQATAYDVRAFAKLEERDTAGAIADLDQAILLDPASAEYKDHRLRAQFMGGAYRLTRARLEQLSQAEPFNETLKTYVATNYYATGEKQRALAEFEDMRNWQRQEDLPGVRAATIQMELGVRTLFDEWTEGSVPYWIDLLADYRMSKISEAEFRSELPLLAPAESKFANCLIEFQVAHKLALMYDTAAARTAFAKAVELCSVGEFEYHAAKAWLKQLGDE
jgi:tetratricopeptide (TPR) repeat protein